MDIKILKLDTTAPSFDEDFSKYKERFLEILSKAFEVYYGDEYQMRRIVEGQSLLFLAIVDNVLVGVSYVKRNLRRGGTVVFPEQYRSLGIGELLVRESLKYFPKQYTILRLDNYPMISLMTKLGFRKAQSIQEVQDIVQDELSKLSDFEKTEDGCLVFTRYSTRREAVRHKLTLLNNFKNEYS